MESTLWTEKYRPESFSDIKGQNDIVKRVSAFVKLRNMPHQMYAGPAGVGKSSLALVVARQLFGKNWRDNFLELNASDERGIDIVRNKVKDFARTKALGDVPFKIIFLDECDALTKEAQQALRRTMENYTATCRFILSCNYSSKIIDPIQSRCAVFRFKSLSDKDLGTIIDIIAKKEKLNLSKAVKDAFVSVSEGDCRRLENIMQSAIALSSKVELDDVYSLAAIAKPKELLDVLKLAASNNFLGSRNQLLDIMLKYGLSGLDIIKQIQKEVWSINIEDKKKLEIIDKCGEIEFRMVEGSDEFIQLEALLAFITYLSSKE
ncbi:replication factor C small subunit [Candidatus Woesearchaeota archaeon]|jgi:replication factor C small subunit|nr:replication factor C small subunit [Candidatus Woesearchaeota archaeon]